MIAWFARNPVAANLLLLLVIVAGLHSVSNRLVLEVFPEFETDRVSVQMSYRGATPEEIEEGILIKIEEAIQDLLGIEEITSSASEGSGTVSVEVAKGHNARELLDDIKSRVDAIATFPDDAERPVFSIVVRRREVIGAVVSGDLPEEELRNLGERVRDELLALKGVTQVDLTEIRPFEISIEVSEQALDEYDLTFDEVVQALSRSSLDLPAGTLKTSKGRIRLRTKGQSYTGADYERLVVIPRGDGTQVTLGDIATVNDGFEEENIDARFNGDPCVVLEVYRVGKQNAMTLASTVKDYVDKAVLPPGAKLTYWRDRSVIIEKRLNTLYVNAFQGALLVIVLLGLFLRPTIAFWVCMGIPVSFLGALAVLPDLGVTVNILSVFGFILVLGIVVDDAIVTGENIYTHLKSGKDPTQAAIDGTEEVSVPVVFGVLTTVAAFMPLAFMEGRRGQIFGQIPIIVIPVLMFSLLESKFVLPSHLAHVSVEEPKGFFARIQAFIADSMQAFAEKLYQPILIKAVWARYLTLALFTVGLAVVTAQVKSGQTRFVFFPRVESETARASLLMPEGTSFETTKANMKVITDAARRLKEKYRDPETGESLMRDILTTAGSSGGRKGQSNIGRVTFQVQPRENRGQSQVGTRALVNEWREQIGPLPGIRELQFRAEIGRGGEPVHVELTGTKLSEMRAVGERIKAFLGRYSGVFEISDSFQQGTPELIISLKPGAEGLGVRLSDIARQVRQAFFGADVQRIQRGRDDVRVMLRYPRSQRDSLGHLESMRIRTQTGRAVPFSEVAHLEFGSGVATIKRINRRRILDITADIDKKTVKANALASELRQFLDKELVGTGIQYTLRGEMQEQSESFSSLSLGLGFVLLATYILLAVPFRSYVQPLVVMAVIPFGWAGAVVGHQMLGMNLSIFSVLGLLALTGVVVNDSLVLVDFVNRARERGLDLLEAVHESGVARFRAIMLTSLTTFVGLTPLIFEKSTQAQFLIPMAVSLAFGVMFSTFVTLFLVPVGVVILEDGLSIARQLWEWLWLDED